MKGSDNILGRGEKNPGKKKKEKVWWVLWKYTRIFSKSLKICVICGHMYGTPEKISTKSIYPCDQGYHKTNTSEKFLSSKSQS